MAHAPDLCGCALEGRYELHALIGEGTFGRVYRGRDRRLARDVAVKVIKPWWSEDPDWTTNFEREAQLLASISDPGIIQIFDVGSAPEGLYYVAELVEGESLASRLRAGPLAPVQAVEIASQLARALAQAHAKRVVHRDIKPANVLLTYEGRVKVGDFGVAVLADASSEAALATIAGTPGYMAPEQARDGATSPATDVYGVGVVLYEMLAGRPPFTGDSAVQIALAHVQDSPPPLPPEVPAELVRIVERALAKDPGERFQTGSALEAALSSLSLRPARTTTGQDAHEASTRRGPGRIARTLVAPRRSPRRNFHPAERRQRVALFLLVLVAVLGMGAVALATAPGHLRVPDVRGMTRTRVLRVADRSKFHAVFTRRYSSRPRDIALDEAPAAGTRVKEGSAVKITLSAGPPPVRVPELVGNSSSEAQALLRSLKLRAKMTQVPAPGVKTGTVTAQWPSAGGSRPVGSPVSLSIAEPPRLRPLTTFSGTDAARSVPFRIRGERWELTYSMAYDDACTWIFICSGPTAKVTRVSDGSTIDQFDLGEGGSEHRVIKSGPGVYQVSVTPGSDNARWDIHVDDYY